MKKTEAHQRNLDERESSILRALVYDYIITGKAVGSRSFVQKYSFSISPATMRNVMFDLEVMGFLIQPHTSAGRIPTDKGYRFYVDSLLDTYDFTLNEDFVVNEDQIKRELQLDKVFTSITRMLATISQYAGIMLTPRPDFAVVKRVELVPLDVNEILFILVTRTGIVINKKVFISGSVTQDDLYNYSKFLSSELCGFDLREIRDSIFNNLRSVSGMGENKAMALDIAQLALGEHKGPEIFIYGIENLLRIPEMVEETRLNSLLNIIEEKNLLREILEHSMDSPGVQTMIGNEIPEAKVAGCSLVTSSYKIGNRNVGALGVIGPTRMDYEKVVPLVDYTGRVVSDFLTKMSK
jgi:heat-inducible transcriptional repressor